MGHGLRLNFDSIQAVRALFLLIGILKLIFCQPANGKRVGTEELLANRHVECTSINYMFRKRFELTFRNTLSSSHSNWFNSFGDQYHLHETRWEKPIIHEKWIMSFQTQKTAKWYCFKI